MTRGPAETGRKRKTGFARSVSTPNSRRRSAQERLTRTADGQMLLTLKAEWSDGTTHLLFEPIELLERLAALTPRPRINLGLHHGCWRRNFTREQLSLRNLFDTHCTTG